MKKFLLSTLILFLTGFALNAQTVLNELYVRPGAGNHEWFELYNNRPDNAATNVDCWTVITYWESGADKGWYVLDLEAQPIAAQDYLVVASATTFGYQGTTGTANINWNNMNATSGRLKKYQWDGASGYNDLTIEVPPTTDVFDFFVKKGGGDEEYIVLVYVDGILRNSLLGGGGNNYMVADAASLPPLPVDMLGSCTDFIVTFSDFGIAGSIKMEFVNEAAGNDNGFGRTADGTCGTWAKTQNPGSHNPGATNGPNINLTSSLVTSVSVVCPSNPMDFAVVTPTITNNPTEPTFPVLVSIIYDINKNAILDPHPTDTAHYQNPKPINAQNGSVSFNTKPAANNYLLITYQTVLGCINKIESVITCVGLPVSFSSFNAQRDNTVINLSWETASEQNNSGFEIQRRIGNSDFETIGFVASKSSEGNSSSVLNYNYTDTNPSDGISQYRLRQVDFDGKYTYSDIRAVREDLKNGKTIIYPNPSASGTVNVVFENTNTIRDVSLIDFSGRIIQQWNNITVNNLRVDNLKSGIYGLRIVNKETGNQNFEKIIVK